MAPWLWAALHPSTAIVTMSLSGTSLGSTVNVGGTVSRATSTEAKSMEDSVSPSLANLPLARFLSLALVLARWWACLIPSQTTSSMLAASAAPRMRP